jgi:peroxiredoxin
MKTLFAFLILTSTLFISATTGGGYGVGDKATDFKLKNVDGKWVSLADFPSAKGFIVIFTCNHCPFAKAYQDRIIALDKEYKPKGYPVIAINSNDPSVVPEDSYSEMQQRAKEKGFTFPYLFDETQSVCKSYGATNTPHVFLLEKESSNNLIVKYIGAIDDNYQDATAVKVNYLKDALESLMAGKDPNPSFTKAIGCSIKFKEQAMN